MRRALGLFALPLLASVTPQYREALPNYPFQFPRDHFEHPDFRTEWWYYTGNVWTPQGHRFGFELVFFRAGERTTFANEKSTWNITDLYLANSALTDIDGQRFSAHERLNRAGPGIAGASFRDRRVWNGNWSATWNGEKQTLDATTSDFSFHLACSPAKSFVIHGEHGVSQKAEGVGHASHYISFPRLSVTGQIRTGDRSYSVSGQAWMDHEWFSHQLQSNQAGWDWFSVQLNNNTELMLFELRRKDGSLDRYSSGTFVAPDGSAHHLTARDFQLIPTEWWKSPKTGASYPIAWSVKIPSMQLELTCRAKMNNQELVNQHGAVYWEGAVDYSGSTQGVGYLEMTGYDKPVDLR